MVTFIHEHIFIKQNNQYYTSGSLDKLVMKRYINIFGNIKLVTRCKKINKDLGNINPSSIENTSFICVPDYKNIKKIHKFFKAKKIIKKEVEKADFIILRSGSFANIAAKHAKKINKPYLIEVVGCAWDANWNYGLLGKIIAPFNFKAQKRAVRDANYAIYVTEDFLQERYPTNGKSTNCSNVALTEFNEGTIEKRLSKIKSMNLNNKIIIGTTAAVDVKYKGQQYIIKALGILKKRGVDNLEYQIVGGGDQTYLKHIAEKYEVSDQVKFLGALSHENVFDWLEEIDLYVQPSKQEGLPRALIEAMSRGVPSFGAKTAGIPELLEKDYVFNNKKNNTEEIITVLMSFSRSNMLTQAQRNYEVSKKYSKDTIDKRRAKFLEEYKESIKN